MNCFNHPSESAVIACYDCGKGLCQRCASKRSAASICSNCNLNRGEAELFEIKEDLKTIYTKGLIFSLIATFGVLLMKRTAFGVIDILAFIPGIYYGASLIVGWKAFKFPTPQTRVIIIPAIGLVIYYFLKLVFAVYFGWILLGMKTIKSIRRYKKVKSIMNKY